MSALRGNVADQRGFEPMTAVVRNELDGLRLSGAGGNRPVHWSVAG
jgi:hypothetical protein